ALHSANAGEIAESPAAESGRAGNGRRSAAGGAARSRSAINAGSNKSGGSPATETRSDTAAAGTRAGAAQNLRDRPGDGAKAPAGSGTGPQEGDRRHSKRSE